jgi:hypothetical protein
MRSAWRALSDFLKNNIISQPAGQGIVDFSYGARRPRPDAFAALENDNFLL